jgi:hypothetical protein
MSYTIDQKNKSIVISGFDKGIADDPFSGISDMRNMNIISVPGEASVNFSTALNSLGSFSGSIVSADPATEKITYSGATGVPVTGQAIVFAGGSLPAGLSAGTQSASTDTNVYWVRSVDLNNQTFTVSSTFEPTADVNITATGTGTFATIDIGKTKYFTYDGTNYWVIDTNGRVWGGARGWQFSGNTTRSNGNGNGLVYYQASDGTGYLFAYRNKRIDYTIISTISWVYGWNTATGGSGADSMKTQAGTNNPHEAIVAPDNKVYFTDANWVGRFYQASPTTAFDPTNTATYVFDQTAVLPFTDIAQCLAPLGNTVLIGGRKNVIYPWDTFSALPSYPILLAEYNIVKLVTVNTNTFAFAGNRGRIYITNGSQGQLYKKLPDHISGTIEPYFTWGGAMSIKNQLYFSASVTTNGGSAISQYGGIWAIDLDSKAMRLTNQLSYGTYAGYSTAMIPIFSSTPSGTGFYAGWDSGSSTYGIDTTSSTPYTGSQATIDSDLIPIGTFNSPTDFERVEYKLTKPMVSGESITIYARLIFNTTDTGFGSAILTDSTVGNFSSSSPVNFKNAQWIQLKVVTNSTASSPSYTRLKEIRITGMK